MKDQIKKAWDGLAESWGKLSPKFKKTMLVSVGFILAAAVLLTVYLEVSAQKMTALFPKLSTVETTAVCSVLSEMGISAEISPAGEIMVPSEQQGELQVQMAGRGFPQSAPTYNLYLNNTGFTRTETEKKQIQLYQLQDLIQASLMQCKGVQNAVVLITIPEKSDYVWEKEKGESSATATITMEAGYELSHERVSAIKNLIAFSVVPQMKAENVKVIDAGTGIELSPDFGALSRAGLDGKRLEYEARMQKIIEDNIKRLLSPIYGADGVTAVAWVTLDYDKMLTEQHQVIPEDDGNGVKLHLDEQYEINGSVPMAGLVGEENNTDTPIYPNQTGNEENQVASYSRNIDWENSYINTQIEKGEAILKSATVSVLVQDSEFDEQRRDDLVNMISKAVNIRADSISVQNYAITPPSQPAVTQPEKTVNKKLLIAAAVGIGLLLILLLILVATMVGRRSKKRLKMEEEESAIKIRDLQAEIEQHKRSLVESAKAKSNQENAIANEVREFSKENPEITASLIRSMLKEDE